jgi:hypothetical protein
VIGADGREVESSEDINREESAPIDEYGFDFEGDEVKESS